MNELVEKALKGNFADVSDGALENTIIFGDFLNYHAIDDAKNGGASPGGGEIVRLYEDLQNEATIKPVLEEVLEKYNSVHKAMNLVLLTTVGHLVRVHRLMRLPRGNAPSSASAAAASSRSRSSPRSPPTSTSSPSR